MSGPLASGSIYAQRVGAGPHNSEFVVDGGSGDVIFNVGPPTTATPQLYPSLFGPYSALPGTGLTAQVKNQDAPVLLNNWLSTYLLDSPPAVTSLTSSVSTAGIQLTYTLPAQKRLGFSSSAVPYIQYVKAQVVASSLNAGGNWTDASTKTLTLETVVGNAFAAVNTLKLLVDAGTNATTGSLYSAYSAITPAVLYDIRVFCTNQSDAPVRYVAAMGVASLSVGTPVAPTGVTANALSTTSASVSWTAPIDHDTNAAGNQATPFVANYKVSRTAAGSVRYGGAIADTGDSFTTTTSGVDSATSLTLSALHPGTSYSLVVAAVNAVNPTYGPASSPATLVTTVLPTAPVYLAPSDVTSLQSVASLRGTYNASGGYSLDGSTAVSPLLAASALTNSNLRTTSMPARRTNFVAGATGTVGALVAYGGPTTTYTAAANTASFSAQGLGTTSTNGSVTSSGAGTSVVYSSDVDAYAGDSAGFYKTIQAYAAGVNVASAYPGSSSQYSLQLQYTPVGGSATQSTQVTFYVTDSNTATAINTLGVTSETAGAVSRISGVPSFTSSAVFKTQFNETEIAHYFLRYDKKHADLVVTSSTGTVLSSTVTVDQTAIGASHKYFTAPASTKYTTSSTLNNSTGLTLAATSTPQEIQFNDFTVALSNASNIFDEGLLVKATPYSVYSDSGGAQVSGAYINTTTGSTLALRVDTKSILADKSAGSQANLATGQHCLSGVGQYPSSGYTAAYDHSVDITTTSDLQLVNGMYSTPAFAQGYKNYSTFYFSGAFAKPNYSTITATSSVRFVTFKYSNLIISSTYTKIRMTLVQSGLTTNFGNVNASNHTLAIKVIDPSGGKGTGWLDCCNAVLGTGLQDGQTDGTSNIDPTYSTTSQRDCVILAGTSSSAVFYVRLGLPCNLAASVTSISLAPVVAFT